MDGKFKAAQLAYDNQTEPDPDNGNWREIPGEPIGVVCAWCTETIRPGRQPFSHGICPACAEAVRKEMEEYND